jgi:hypothetical protein
MKTLRLIQKALALLPEAVQEVLITGRLSLAVTVEPDPGLPRGMSAGSEDLAGGRFYTIVVHHEHIGWPKELFIGAFLRELGHVVAGRPPESQWPTERPERARFRERLECAADAMVWKWGLKDYSMRFLQATYPTHRAQAIADDIDKMLREETESEPPQDGPAEGG